MLGRILKRLIYFLTSRIFLIAVILITQLFVILSFVLHLGIINPVVRYLLFFLNICLVIKVVNRNSNTYYKLAWIIIILGLPLTGGIVYLMFAEKKVPKPLRAKILEEGGEAKNLFERQDIRFKHKSVEKIYKYVANVSDYPYYKNTEVEHFEAGEMFFADLIKRLDEAQNFVFIEMFIIKDGYMLDTLLAKLDECIKRGVKVYLLYDDGGNITCLPEHFEENLKARGINVHAFSKVSVFLSLLSKANNRSHRKIIVIDNKYAYTGGFNLADEYINKIERFGYWKDTGILLKGEAVWNFTVTFIQFYNASCHYNDKQLRYMDFKLEHDFEENDTIVLPFSDSPTDNEDIGYNVHLSMINSAKRYIYISTPYLVIDYNIITALTTAAKSGVEVIITVPHIPDKKTVFMVTRSNYEELIKAGVRIFEYTPGFIHSKMIIIDDQLALNGTINMDFRSYYLNYECGVLVYNDDEIKCMRNDYLHTIAQSEEINSEKIKKVHPIVIIFRAILNVFAPLL